MDGLEIILHEPASEDERGQIVKYLMEDEVGEIVAVERKKGTVSGNHYHKGLDASKNPERLYLIKGRISLHVKNLASGEEQDQEIGPNTELRIHPNILHTLTTLEDSIFLEINKASGFEGDLFREDE